MIIRWTIKKKRGNLRPLLTVEMHLTDNERELCVPVVHQVTTIPKPPDAGLRNCLPDQNERREGWQPEVFHALETPFHKNGSCSEQFILPWRGDNQYPEVEASLATLRDEFERRVCEACDSAPMDVSGEIETSAATKRHLAPTLAAERILQLVNAG